MTVPAAIFQECERVTQELMNKGWSEQSARIKAVGIVEESRHTRKTLKELLLAVATLRST